MGRTQSKFDGAGRLVETGYVDVNQQNVRSRLTDTYSGLDMTVRDAAATAGSNADNPGSVRTIRKNAAGRIAQVTGTLNAVPQVTTYNSAGALTNITYPSGRRIMTGYDNAGRAAAVTGSMAGANKNYVGIASASSELRNTTCAQCIQFAPHGAISQAYLSQNSGGQWAINEQHSYNGRLQPISISTSRVSPSQTIRSLTYGYAASQQPDGAGNNGNLLSQTISGTGLPSTVTQTYAYDGVNRIARVVEGGCNPLQGLEYDRWGNFWVSSYTQSALCSSPGPNTPVANVYSAATNRSSVNSATWDAPGRQLSMGGYTITNDAENRMTSATLDSKTVYQYDGDGRRVRKTICPGTGECTLTSPGASTVWYVYDAGGNLALEYGQSSLATPLSCATCYLMSDHLGSTRVMTDQDGNAVAGGCHDYLPFGEGIYATIGQRSTYCYPSSVVSGVLFASKERDRETGLDHFGARYLSGVPARFKSPDPAAYQLQESQTPDRCSYVNNNPLKHVDPTGREAQYVVDEMNSTIMIHATTTIYGHNASTDYATKLKGAMESAWKGSYKDPKAGTTYKVPTTAEVSVYNPILGAGLSVRNAFYVGNDVSRSRIDYRHTDPRSPSRYPGNPGVYTGIINPSAGVERHEAGHVLGEPDDYWEDSTRGTFGPQPSHAGHLMAEANSVMAAQDEIDRIGAFTLHQRRATHKSEGTVIRLPEPPRPR